MVSCTGYKLLGRPGYKADRAHHKQGNYYPDIVNTFLNNMQCSWLGSLSMHDTIRYSPCKLYLQTDKILKSTMCTLNSLYMLDNLHYIGYRL